MDGTLLSKIIGCSRMSQYNTGNQHLQLTTVSFLLTPANHSIHSNFALLKHYHYLVSLCSASFRLLTLLNGVFRGSFEICSPSFCLHRWKYASRLSLAVKCSNISRSFSSDRSQSLSMFNWHTLKTACLAAFSARIMFPSTWSVSNAMGS